MLQRPSACIPIILYLLTLATLLSGLALAAVPNPESYFGHPIGIDRQLLDWDKVVSYFQALAKTSDKIRVKELGKTAEGRPFIAATISSAATLRNLDHYQAIQAKLADPRKTPPEEAEKLFQEALEIDRRVEKGHGQSVHAAAVSASQLVGEVLRVMGR